MLALIASRKPGRVPASRIDAHPAFIAGSVHTPSELGSRSCFRHFAARRGENVGLIIEARQRSEFWALRPLLAFTGRAEGTIRQNTESEYAGYAVTLRGFTYVIAPVVFGGR